MCNRVVRRDVLDKIGTTIVVEAMHKKRQLFTTIVTMRVVKKAVNGALYAMKAVCHGNQHEGSLER